MASEKGAQNSILTTRHYNTTQVLAWENSRHLATPLLVSPAKWRLRNKRRNSILMTHHYPDLSSASDWLNQILPRGTTNLKHYPALGSDSSSVWNFCARFSNVIWRGNQWWLREMLAFFFFFSVYLISKIILILNLSMWICVIRSNRQEILGKKVNLE